MPGRGRIIFLDKSTEFEKIPAISWEIGQKWCKGGPLAPLKFLRHAPTKGPLGDFWTMVGVHQSGDVTMGMSCWRAD
jgi:hypothetical protein